MADYYIGASGWSYVNWKQVFYPAGVPQRSSGYGITRHSVTAFAYAGKRCY